MFLNTMSACNRHLSRIRCVSKKKCVCNFSGCNHLSAIKCVIPILCAFNYKSECVVVFKSVLSSLENK